MTALTLTVFTESMATQTESTLFWIRFWEIGLPPLLCIVSAVLLFQYPLTESRAYQIKALLAQRKGEAAAPPA